ncbi:FtsW/RodA/SpoVE family cell cycle protein [Lysinibacillus sp. PB211]|nr:MULTISPECIES: FtsW/RodA/SpoVE family cell cycle protein [Lysinibacillus]MCS1398039.1 FtsW/RodA/SpoVE family cell cycle protein [Lysinibacillus sp. PB211]MDR0158758.1 FtsW/RodA/SpoVE family cell cycle protein [Lysinibacillus sphaericus]
MSLSLLGFISCLFVHSSSTVFEQYTSSFIVKQLFYYLIGFLVMYGVATLDIEQLKKVSWPFYWVMERLATAAPLLPLITPSLNKRVQQQSLLSYANILIQEQKYPHLLFKNYAVQLYVDKNLRTLWT